MSVKDYQNFIQPFIQSKFADLEVRNEWTAFTGFKNHYSPRVDIAVGPFSTTPGQNRIHEYDSLLEANNCKSFIRRLYNFHVDNIGLEVNNEIRIPQFDDLIHKNLNARCFLAIEIENKNSKKHIMGSLINAASLGRVGVGIAYTDSTMRTFIRLMNYLGFLKRVEKNTYDTTNFLLVSRNQIQNLLTERNKKNGSTRRV